MKKIFGLAILVFVLGLFVGGCSDGGNSKDPKDRDTTGNNNNPLTNWYDSSKTEFTITTETQLRGLATLVNSGTDFFRKTVILGNDVVINNGEWIPIGAITSTQGDQAWGNYIISNLSEQNFFRGTFNGNGKSISGVYVNQSDKNFQGFFSVLPEEATVRNLELIDFNVAGKNYVGGLAGLVYSRQLIENVYSTGIVDGNNNVGGLAGVFGGRITRGHSMSTVYGQENVGGLFGYLVGGSGLNNSSAGGNVIGIRNVGGLVGESRLASRIDNSRATSGVIGDSAVGGLVGRVVDGDIRSSYATGNVNGEIWVGGLVGAINGISPRIHNTYATGNTSGIRAIGGLIGAIPGGFPSIQQRSTWFVVANSYAIGSVAGDEQVGGLIGSGYINHDMVSLLNNSFYNTETTAQSDNDGRGEPRTTTEMKQEETFTNWNFSNIWGISPTINNGFPYLRVFQ
ncbi:MAG: hypothetical protein FWE23_08285 [Chitinivibrionia bacterium]|nr:hypothetical protein [Chitinivibrionia bacterium]